MSNISLLSDLAEYVNNIPNAAPGDDVIARRALIRDGNADLLPYFFGSCTHPNAARFPADPGTGMPEWLECDDCGRWVAA